MANLTRGFLNGQGLESDVVDAIMAEYGKDVSALNTQINELNDTNAELSKKTIDFEAVKEERDNYANQLEEAKREAGRAKREALIKVELTKGGAKERYYKVLEDELKDVEDDAIAEKIKELRSEMVELFEVEQETERKGGFQVLDNKLKEGAEPAGLTVDQIMAVEDKTKREQLIRENGHLF